MHVTRHRIILWSGLCASASCTFSQKFNRSQRTAIYLACELNCRTHTHFSVCIEIIRKLGHILAISVCMGREGCVSWDACRYVTCCRQYFLENETTEDSMRMGRFPMMLLFCSDLHHTLKSEYTTNCNQNSRKARAILLWRLHVSFTHAHLLVQSCPNDTHTCIRNKSGQMRPTALQIAW